MVAATTVVVVVVVVGGGGGDGGWKHLFDDMSSPIFYSCRLACTNQPLTQSTAPLPNALHTGYTFSAKE
jgi:hypothetical protein